ncbi:hypothetical protein CEXT_337131 [Caerostris extrusa]|uniref:Uncharacterized protein n=1 Tax=Caerostris extrusa TaxID=172846 RepID=A0AAV4RD65_CAEEX|nr:hypothetical protein CEXT_337131 [Caerostris extrusa]
MNRNHEVNRKLRFKIRYIRKHLVSITPEISLPTSAETAVILQAASLLLYPLVLGSPSPSCTAAARRTCTSRTDAAWAGPTSRPSHPQSWPATVPCWVTSPTTTSSVRDCGQRYEDTRICLSV